MNQKVLYLISYVDDVSRNMSDVDVEATNNDVSEKVKSTEKSKLPPKEHSQVEPEQIKARIDLTEGMLQTYVNTLR